MTNQRRSLPARSERDRALLEEQERSGLSIAAFARERGIPAWRLYHARRARVGRRAPSVDLVEIGGSQAVTAIAAASPVGGLEMMLPNGLRIAVPPAFEESTLRRLLAVLASC